jgi:cytochrome c-type biogenesis protein CcmE
MSHKTAKIGITSLVLAAAIGGLLWASLSEGTQYYKHVDEVMTQPDQWYGKSLRLHGYVVKDSILKRRDSLDYRFQIQNNGKMVAASYTGVVPDTFKSEAEVVVTGRLGADGFSVEPNGVMAKCPSKYQAKDGAPGAVRPQPATTGSN